jgi:hypothetical protein
MRNDFFCKAILIAAICVAATASSARAQGIEVGTSLIGATIGLGDDNDVSTVAVPTSGFGIINPGVYASFLMSERFAVEPQLGLLWISGNGESAHVVNLSGQVDYFLNGYARSSTYLFASAGIIDLSDSDTTPKSVSGGIGYRVASERLAFRLDGRLMHLTDNGGDSLSFTLSIGGLFR